MEIRCLPLKDLIFPLIHMTRILITGAGAVLGQEIFNL